MVSPVATQLARWRQELHLVEQEVRLDLGPLSAEQFNWRPADGKWSVAECIDHLALVTGLMLEKAKPVLERARAEGRTGEGPYRYGMMGGWFAKMMEQPGKRPRGREAVGSNSTSRRGTRRRWPTTGGTWPKPNG